MGMGLAYGCACVTAYRIQRIRNQLEIDGIDDYKRQQQLLHSNWIFSQLAGKYDSQVAWDEWMFGIVKQRKDLIQKAQGLVLEVGAGTGRNLAYYDDQTQVVVSDQSENMLREAMKKHHHQNMVFKVVDIADASRFPSNTFDTL